LLALKVKTTGALVVELSKLMSAPSPDAPLGPVMVIVCVPVPDDVVLVAVVVVPVLPPEGVVVPVDEDAIVGS